MAWNRIEGVSQQHEQVALTPMSSIIAETGFQPQLSCGHRNDLLLPGIEEEKAQIWFRDRLAWYADSSKKWTLAVLQPHLLHVCP